MITIRYNSFFPIILRFFQYFNRIFPIKFHLFSSQKYKVFTMKKRRFFALKKSFLHPKTPLFPTRNQSFNDTFLLCKLYNRKFGQQKSRSTDFIPCCGFLFRIHNQIGRVGGSILFYVIRVFLRIHPFRERKAVPYANCSITRLIASIASSGSLS